MAIFMKVTLRLPLSVHRAVNKAAEASGRSLNSEIVSRLNESLGNPYLSEKDANDDLLYRLSDLEARVAQLEHREPVPAASRPKRRTAKAATGAD